MEKTAAHFIPMVDLKAQYRSIRLEIDEAIQGVLDSAGFIMGEAVGAFEASFSSFCGADHCVGVSSGTSALTLALLAMDVGPGEEVIVPSHTFTATAEAISAVGATPVFVDIDPLTYNLDPLRLKQSITQSTRVIMPVHLYGQPADMPRINAVACEAGLSVVEDAAQAHGASLGGKMVGTMGDVACFSFYPGKNLGAYGDAGALTTNDHAIADQVSLLRNHGRRSKYLHEIVGYGERLDTIQAAVLQVKLGHLMDWNGKRRRLAARYGALLGNCEVILPFVAEHAEPVWHLYVIRTDKRDSLLEFLISRGIGAGVHYPVPLHLQQAYAHLGYVRGDLPVTEMVADTCLSLPIYPEMTDEQQDAVISQVYAFFDGESA
jgi:dTDP-4-amino-4,6-dideoxygalactose transaminase